MSPSSLKVSVAWDSPTTYAGEELRCTITFRNTAPDPAQLAAAASSARRGSSKPRPPALSSASTSSGFRDEWSALPRSGRPSIALSEAPKRPGHRQTASLNTPTTRRLGSVPNTPTIDELDASAPANTRGSRTPKHSHKRSISIVSHASSIESGPTSGKREQTAPNSPAMVTSPRRSPHTRAASYHGPPGKMLGSAGGAGGGTNGMLSPRANGGIGGGMRSPKAPTLVRAATAGAAKTMAQDQGIGSAKSPLLQANEEEDLDSLADDASQTTENVPSASGRSVSAPLRQKAFHSPLPHRDKADHTLHRVVSPVGTEASPRTSIDLMSNFSEDTFASEYVQSGGLFRFASQRHSRQNSTMPSAGSSPVSTTEHLMMGYVQLQGSFVLDSSLVDQSPFEEVKQMGVIGGQGSGGVVGVGAPKRNSGILSSFGLSSLGVSFGGILGGQEMSSMRDMKGIASTKSIPLISTPQSILFVDLELRPGQSKKFTYRHLLPQDLPPTHKGRAMKVEYQLTIGTQRAQTVGQKNNVRQVDIPFRVFPGIYESGALVTHDLMEPHILLRDQAVTKAADEKKHRPSMSKSASAIRSRDAFLAYTSQLLKSSPDETGEALLSPTEARRESTILLAESDSAQPAPQVPMRELIEQTVTRPMLAEPSARSPNQFAIQRAGAPVAVISLVRPAYRLGETVTAVIDLSSSASHVFALHASLESEETVDEALALRSSASIRRATRRIHAHGSEQTASQNRAVFRFMVPWNATPEFSTSGVRVEWRLRVEFVCSAYPKVRRTTIVAKTSQVDRNDASSDREQGKHRRKNGIGDGSNDNDDNYDENEDDSERDSVSDSEDADGAAHDDVEGEELLEEVNNDERGVVYAALQEVHCENFEVGVPIRVFGADGGSVAKTAGTHSRHSALRGTATAAASTYVDGVEFSI